MLLLNAAEIQIWVTPYDALLDEGLYSSYLGLLSAAEREQEPRFYFERDRRRYLLTRVLVRTVLSRYVSLAPDEWRFATNAYGRPEVVNSQGRELVFNVAHTHSLIVMGVTTGRALGVDVENIRARTASIEIAQNYFSPQEADALAAMPEEQQAYRFLEYWTFKESYIKARGMGLSLPLDHFAFSYPDERTVEVSVKADLGDDPGHWQFWQLRIMSDYLVAVCGERLGTQPAALIVREVVPMRSENLADFALLRTCSRGRKGLHETSLVTSHPATETGAPYLAPLARCRI